MLGFGTEVSWIKMVKRIGVRLSLRIQLSSLPMDFCPQRTTAARVAPILFT
jgi:hypothetical protein